MTLSLNRRSFSALLAASAFALPRAAHADTAVWRNAELLGEDGRRFRTGDLRAPLTLVMLWANWCPNCLSAMDSIATMRAAVGPRNLDVLLVSHPEYWAEDQAMARARNIPFRLATMSSANSQSVIREALTEAGGAYAVPRTLLVRGDTGAVTPWRRGSQDWASAGLVRELRSSLG